MNGRRVVWLLLLVVLVVEIVGLGAVVVLTRTRWGMDRVRSFTEALVNERIPGTVRVARVDGPGLLGGVRLHGIVVEDPEGRTVLRADSARISYDWRTFLQRRIVLSDAIVWNPDVHISREPGEEAWGIQRAFMNVGEPDTTAGSGPGTVVEVRTARIVGGHIMVRQAIDERETAGPWVIEDAAGGRVRILEFTDFDATLDRIAVNTDEEPGLRVDIAELDMHARVLQTAFDVIGARGRVALVDSILAIALPEVRLPASRAAVRGRVVLGSEGPRLDLVIAAADVALRDLRWLDARVPERGSFSGDLAITSEPAGLAFRATNATLAVDGSRITGDAGVSLAGPMRLRDVALDLAPLELSLLDEYLPADLPIEGTVRGRIAADGPLAALRTRGDVRAQPRGAARPADIRWNGTIGVSDDPLLRAVSIEIRTLEAQALEPIIGARLQGTLDATVVVDGRLRSGVNVNGSLTHRLAEGRVSFAEVEGEVRSDGATTALDLALQFAPLHLEAVAPFADALADLTGEVNGSAALQGTLHDLAVQADLRSTAGHVIADGRLQRNGSLAYAGTLDFDHFTPVVHLARLPDAGITGRIVFDMAGTTVATLEGSLGAVLDSIRWERTRAGPVRFAGSFADGVVRVDTLVLDAPGVIVRAEGDFGLDSTSTGVLTATASSTSLQPLERFVFDGEPEDPTQPRLDGRGEAEVRIEGNIARFDVAGNLDMVALRVADNRVHALRVNVDATALRSPEALIEANATVDSLFVLGHTADSASFVASLRGGVLQFTALVADSARDRLRLSGTGTRAGDSLQATLQELRLGDGETAWRLEGETQLTMAGPVITVQDLRLRREEGAGSFEASGHVVRLVEAADTIRMPLAFSARLENVPVDELAALAGYPVQATGTVGGTLQLTGTPAAPIIDGDIGIQQFTIGEAALDSVAGRVDYANRNLQIDVQAFRGGRRVLLGDGRVPIDLRLGATGERRLAEDLDFTVQADSMPARFMLGFIDALHDVDGMIDGQVSGRGTTRDPQLTGAFVLRRGALTLPVIGVRYSGAIGTFAFQRGMVLEVDLSGRSSSSRAGGELTGSMRVTGEVDLEQPSNPAFDLRIQAQRLLAADRRDVRAVISGQGAVQGFYQSPEVSGDIRVDEGMINVDELYRQYLVVGLEDPLLFDMVDTTLVAVRRVMPASENPFLRNLRVQDFNVSVTQEAWLRSREMNVELAGDLNVIFDRVIEDLRLSGTLRTVRGTYRLDYPPFARVFDVQEGTVEFPGTPGINPNLSLRALYRVRAQAEPLDIYAVVTGTLESPRVDLESDADPPISESDLASYLFFGVPTYAINFGGGPSAGGGVLTNLSSLAAPTVFGYVGAGLQTLAQSIGVLDYVGFTAAEASAGQQQTAGLGNLVQNAQIELGRYITPRTFVIWTQRVGTPDPSWDVRLEWRLNRGFTAELFAEDRFARTPSFGLSQIANSRVYGFLLYREWGY